MLPKPRAPPVAAASRGRSRRTVRRVHAVREPGRRRGLPDRWSGWRRSPAIRAAGQPSAAAAAGEEKTEFNVVLEGFTGDKKVDAIKKVREITNLPLMDAKKLVEGGTGVLKEGASKEEAEKIKKEIEALGGKIALK